MDFEFTEEQRTFKREVHDFFTTEPWGEIQLHAGLPYSASFYKKMAKRGWLGLLFPKQYGGLGLDNIYETILQEEIGYTGAPLGVIYGLTILGNATIIASCGSDQLKKEYLPRIIKAEIMPLCQAFTEPEAGCNLASVQTRAVREGDYYIINGQKMFSTFGDMEGAYSVLMARTDPDAPLEKGISLFIVDNSTPGISFAPPMPAMGSYTTTQAFYDDVRIPKENLVGRENRGWDCFTQNKARYWQKTGAIRLGQMEWMFDSIIRYVRETKSNGHPLSQNPSVRQKLAEMAIDIKVTRLLAYRLAWMLSKGLDALALGAMVKVFRDEALPRFWNKVMQILGLYGQLRTGSSYAPLHGSAELLYRADALKHFVDCGGASVTRNFVASYGLDLGEFH